MGMKTFGSRPMVVSQARYSRFDLVEPLLAVVLEVHLVHQHRDLADAQQVEQVAVAAGVFLHAFVRVDEQQRRLGTGGAGDHVLEKLLVARRVDDHVLALLRSETRSARCRS